MRNWNLTLGVSLLLALSAAVAFGQMATGRVVGSVRDTSGNPIESARITATGYGKTMEATSGSDGKWGILGFRSGTYDFAVEAAGFEPQAYKQQVKRSGRNPPMDFVLDTAAVSPERGGASAGAGLLGEANELFASGQYAEALAKYEEILVADPSLYQVHLSIGNVYQKMGDDDKALEAFNEVLAVDPLNTASLVSIGEIFVRQQNLDEAVAYFEKAIDQTSDEVVPFNVAEIYFEQGNADKALGFYQLAAERKPDWQDPQLKMAFAYLNKGDMESAGAALQKVVEMGPDTPQGQQAQQMLTSLPK